MLSPLCVRNCTRRIRRNMQRMHAYILNYIISPINNQCLCAGVPQKDNRPVPAGIHAEQDIYAALRRSFC